MSNHSVKFHKDTISSFISNPVKRQTDRQTHSGKSITSLAKVVSNGDVRVGVDGAAGAATVSAVRCWRPVLIALSRDDEVCLDSR